MTNQRGVTLLLSILILSAMSLVAAAVSTFVVREIRSSRATLLTEPGYAAAEAGIQQGLWTLKRDDISAVTACKTNPPLVAYNAVSEVTYCKSFGGGTFDITVQPIDILLYNPDDPNGDIDLLDGAGVTYYNNVDVLNTGPVSIRVEILRLDDTPVASALIAPGDPVVPFPIAAVAVGREGRLIVRLSTLGGAAVSTAFVDTNEGLPDIVSISSLGCNTKLTTTSCAVDTGSEIFNRKIEVNLGN